MMYSAYNHETREQLFTEDIRHLYHVVRHCERMYRHDGIIHEWTFHRASAACDAETDTIPFAAIIRGHLFYFG